MNLGRTKLHSQENLFIWFYHFLLNISSFTVAKITEWKNILYGGEEKNLYIFISSFLQKCSECRSVKLDCSKSLGCAKSDFDEVGGVRQFGGRGRGHVGHSNGEAGGKLSRQQSTATGGLSGQRA